MACFKELRRGSLSLVFAKLHLNKPKDIWNKVECVFLFICIQIIFEPGKDRIFFYYVLIYKTLELKHFLRFLFKITLFFKL